VSAVAAARSAARNALLASKRQTSVSTAARDNVNLDFVDEHQGKVKREENGVMGTPLLHFDGEDADDSAARAVILELHPTRDLGEDRIVFAPAGIPPGTKSPSPLANDNRPARHEVPVVRLDAQPLRVRVAAVSRAALSFFMRHIA